MAIVGSWAARLLILSLLLSGCQSSNDPPSSDDIETLHSEATAAFQRGEFDGLDTLTAKGLQKAEALGDPEWVWSFKLLRFELLIYDDNEVALAMLDGEPPENYRARVLVDRARALARLMRYSDAEDALREAETLLPEDDRALPVELQVTRADLLRKNGRLAEADALYEKAYQAATAGDLPRLQAKIAGNRGLLHENQDRYDKAILLFEMALDAASRAGDKGYRARAMINLGFCYHRLGFFEKALETYQTAEALATESQTPDLVASSRGEIGTAYFGLEDFDKATEYYLRAVEISPDDYERSKWLNNLASLNIERRNWAEAQRYNDMAMELRLKDAAAGQFIDYSKVNAAEIAVGTGRLDEAGGIIDDLLARKADLEGEVLCETYASKSELSALKRDAEGARRNYELALAQLEKIPKSMSSEEYRISFRSKWNHFTQSYVEYLVSEGDSAQALERAEASRALELSGGLGIPAKRDSGPSEALFQAAARRMNAVLMSYWLAPKKSYLWVVTPNQLKVFDLPDASTIESLVEGYHNYLVNAWDPIADRNEYASELFDILVGPAASLIPAGSKVVLVPDGRLHDLNFETLVTDAENPRYWIEDVTLSVAPSLAILRPDKPSNQPQKSLLLIGDPVQADAAFPRLPAAKTEIESIRRRFRPEDQTVFVGADAVPQAYFQAEPERYQLVHFAAHAVANPIHFLSSSVILAPRDGSYRLFAKDVEEIPLDASVVTLSACRSAGAKSFSGEGLVGFAWAFLKAGAHNVVAGLWDVDDANGAKLMDEFYAAMVAGESPAAALRQAKLQMIGSGVVRPVYWAPFQIYTCSSPFRPIRSVAASSRHHQELQGRDGTRKRTGAKGREATPANVSSRPTSDSGWTSGG